MSQIPAGLAECQVSDEDGHSVKVGDLWSQRTTVVTWVRHFGCLFCREHVVELQGEIDKIHAAGAEVVIIGSGTPNFIAGFRDTTRFTGPIYSDPERKSYAAAGLKRGLLRTMNPVSGVHAITALVRGFRVAKLQGDNAQQGGVFVVRPGGEVLYSHVSKVAGDNAPVRDILKALAPPPAAAETEAKAHG